MDDHDGGGGGFEFWFAASFCDMLVLALSLPLYHEMLGDGRKHHGRAFGLAKATLQTASGNLPLTSTEKESLKGLLHYKQCVEGLVTSASVTGLHGVGPRAPTDQLENFGVGETTVSQ
jgi:hypothetical protein